MLASVLAWLAWRASGPLEPVFKGRKLTSWLESHVPTSSANPPYNSPGWKQADEALRAIGSNAVPTLLEMIRAKDPPPWRLKLLLFAGRFRWTGVNYRYAWSRNEEAEYAFEVLGTNAVSAVPELIKLYEEDVLPSSYAARALGHIGRGANPALPNLLRRFTHTNSNVRFCAVSAVMYIGGEPSVVVPALTSALQDPSVDVRWNALVGLSGFGTRARPAVPEILKMVDDQAVVGSSPVRTQVETALWRIAPEKVGKPLVVENATPIATNGITAQALKLVFYGKRQALIPEGRPVPIVAQYWSSDPRPKLTLYRGASGSEDTDHFLGEFEVLDLPASDSLNVSTLCVIADGQIVLCARDNRRDVFLGIRRVGAGTVK